MTQKLILSYLVVYGPLVRNGSALEERDKLEKPVSESASCGLDVHNFFRIFLGIFLFRSFQNRKKSPERKKEVEQPRTAGTRSISNPFFLKPIHLNEYNNILPFIVQKIESLNVVIGRPGISVKLNDQVTEPRTYAVA